MPVASLTERDVAVKAHFTNPEVQFIGSTSGCGCDFPHVVFQGGDWYFFEDSEIDEEQAASDLLNREGLVGVLQSTRDSMIELYGMWDGDFADAPRIFEDISLETILKSDFRFKERGFYRVHLHF
ncbi:hypothetical protein [Acidicapsa acidisoli]|uniref:hypothetical protein n=1 Tax=Acidicapsa acidisoli TaxID=1615681 RepID=UPI0021DFB809|nr:hypothetical protein [Acidicapsa acidisoli]